MTEFSANTHPGLRRGHNEDCYAAEPELGLWLVADGVGGHASGEIASAIVRDTLTAEYAAGNSLIDAICTAHQAVLAEMDEDAATYGMGSTVVAASLKNYAFNIAWVGDSRAYLWNGKLQQLTRDHSQVAALLEQGIISPAEAAKHPERHVLTQSMGISKNMQLKPEEMQGSLEKNQQLILCSDGLTDELSDREITDIMQRNYSPKTQTDALVSAALHSGGRDNITVIVVGRYETSNAQKAIDPQATQNVHRAMKDAVQEAPNHDRKVWIIVGLMSVVALAIWLQAF